MELVYDNLKIAALICLIAYPLTKNRSFHKALLMIPSKGDTVLLSILFGILSMVGSFMGVEIFDKITIQSRIVGPVVGGIIAGPVVGIVSGTVGGIYCYYTEGFTAVSSMLASISAGAIGGFVYKRFGKSRISFLKAFLAGATGELISSVFMLFLAKPQILAILVVKMISPVTILVNSLGIATFIAMVKDIQYGHYLTGANYAEKALEIAKQTLPVLKKGFNIKTANEIAEIVYTICDVDAVSVTDTEKIMAFKGEGEDHHTPGLSIFPKVIPKESDKNMQVLIANSKEEMGCLKKECKLEVVVGAPLMSNRGLLGYIQLYKVTGSINPLDIKMVTGIADLLSMQLQNSELDRKEKLLAKAEYAALRAQVNPHFLFNTLSVIKLLIRIDPDQAKDLIVKLAAFFRKILNRSDDLMPLSEEIEVVKLYSGIQKARFNQNLQIQIDIDEKYYKLLFPTFVLQPLVENCMNHGFANKSGLMIVKVTGRIKGKYLSIWVTDNGSGFPEQIIKAVERDITTDKMGIGLTNINRRLKNLYGRNYIFKLENLKDGGRVSIQIPIEKHKRSV